MTLCKVAVASVVAVVCAACSGNPTGPSASNRDAAVQFRLDQNSCAPIFGVQTLSFTFFVDGVSVGTEVLGVNTVSSRYTVIAGAHTASANVPNTSARWQNLNFSVPSGQTFTYLLLC